MTSLIACLSSGKGSWAKIYNIINGAVWEKVFLITNDFGKEKFEVKKGVELIVLDLDKSPDILSDEIIAALHDRDLGSEIAINLSSGSGDEHMALLSAVLKLGVGIRLVFAQNGKVEELKLFDFSFE